jgi:predicted nucleotidyltransferase
MNDNEKLEKIKEIILDECQKAGVVVDRIILFGSRARGDNREDSDFDIMVLTDKTMEFGKKQILITKIKRVLAFEGIPNDIIFYNKNYFDEVKMFPGDIGYYVNKEGRVI